MSPIDNGNKMTASGATMCVFIESCLAESFKNEQSKEKKTEKKIEFRRKFYAFLWDAVTLFQWSIESSIVAELLISIY